jgi:predicted PurR-regulated permease PerM
MNDGKHTHISISTGTMIRAAIIVVAIFAIIKLRDIILVVLTAIVIASFVESGVKKMQPYIKNRAVSVFLIYLVSFAIVVGLFSAFVPVFLEEMSALVDQTAKYIPNGSILNSFQPDTITGAKGVVSTISHNASIGEVINSTKDLTTSLSGGFITIFGKAFGGILNLILIIIISFYLSVKEKGIENFLRIVVPDKHEEYVIDLWLRTEHKIGLWMQGQMLLGVIVGLLTYLGLMILGVKYALVIALLTAVLELVPFGILLAVIPAMLFGYLGGGVSLAFMVGVLYFIIHQFEAYLIYPLIVKKVIGISQLVVILSLLIGYTLAGFWGVVLAIPVSVSLLEFLDDREKKKITARAN